MAEGESEFYSAEEACRVLNVKVATLYSYVNRGLLKSYRQSIRRQRLYRKSEVHALLAITPADGDGEQIPWAENWTGDR